MTWILNEIRMKIVKKHMLQHRKEHSKKYIYNLSVTQLDLKQLITIESINRSISNSFFLFSIFVARSSLFLLCAKNMIYKTLFWINSSEKKIFFYRDFSIYCSDAELHFFHLYNFEWTIALCVYAQRVKILIKRSWLNFFADGWVRVFFINWGFKWSLRCLPALIKNLNFFPF